MCICIFVAPYLYFDLNWPHLAASAGSCGNRVKAGAAQSKLVAIVIVIIPLGPIVVIIIIITIPTIIVIINIIITTTISQYLALPAPTSYK